LMMPEMDGFTFVSEVRSQSAWRDIPILVLTAKDLTRSERGRLNGSVQQVFQKGVTSRKRLVQEIHRLMPTPKPASTKGVDPEQ
jgi:CheY-like chemotaxis protein